MPLLVRSDGSLNSASPGVKFNSSVLENEHVFLPRKESQGIFESQDEVGGWSV